MIKPDSDRLVRIGDLFRYASTFPTEDEFVDGHRNWVAFAHDRVSEKKILLEQGINTPAPVGRQNRRPCVVVYSNPQKDLPWRDSFDVDNGHVRYFGDNKEAGRKPDSAPGNAAMLSLFEEHSGLDASARMLATPLIFIRNPQLANRPKGYREFMGFGVIRSVEMVSQRKTNNSGAFTNYVFNCVVLSMAEESETFDWAWIDARRNPKLNDDEVSLLAPKAWKEWVKSGSSSLERIKRRVASRRILKAIDQKPLKGSKESATLQAIYDFYDKKSRFECLAALVAERLLNVGGTYDRGWVTAAGGDGGKDFIGRLRAGASGFGSANLIVLGQAKCEKLNSPTGGNHIARTVARLKRGWLGVYVTTSYFSEAVQREVIEDEYPIMLVNGLQIAEVLQLFAHERGESIEQCLIWIDSQYEEMLSDRRPEELLLE